MKTDKSIEKDGHNHPIYDYVDGDVAFISSANKVRRNKMTPEVYNLLRESAEFWGYTMEEHRMTALHRYLMRSQDDLSEPSYDGYVPSRIVRRFHLTDAMKKHLGIDDAPELCLFHNKSKQEAFMSMSLDAFRKLYPDVTDERIERANKDLSIWTEQMREWNNRKNSTHESSYQTRQP